MKKKILIIFAIVIFFAAAGTVFAAGGFGLDKTATQAGYETSGTSASLTGRIEMIISTILGLVALAFFALTLYGGIIWLTARGKEEKVTQAKEILEAAIIGLIVISASYAIAKFVFSRLSNESATGEYCYWTDMSCTSINNDSEHQSCIAEGGEVVATCD